MKILKALGSHPQLIKASVVSHAIAATPGLNEVQVHTGHNVDANMSDAFFAELGMDNPDFFLDIHSGTHGTTTARLLEAVEKVLLQEKPGVVMVYGDTASIPSGALAVAKLHIPMAHAEAGLRSFNMAMPEEVNPNRPYRISHWLFTHTQAAAAKLLLEGDAADKIMEVGELMGSFKTLLSQDRH